jgi:hypothetical protein
VEVALFLINGLEKSDTLEHVVKWEAMNRIAISAISSCYPLLFAEGV